jgi:hypothetical protein
MDVRMRLFCIRVVLCVGSHLASALSPLKERPRPNKRAPEPNERKKNWWYNIWHYNICFALVLIPRPGNHSNSI